MEIAKATGLGSDSVWSALRRCWRKGLILRAKRVIRERLRAFKGRAGIRSNLRSYYLYVLKPKGVGSLTVDGVKFVNYEEHYLDKRSRVASKASLLLNFLKRNRDRAYFSKELAEALKDRGVKPSDVMSNLRRFERKGLVYVRGYKMHDRQTPFKEGYLITWIDPNRPRDRAIEEAVERTEKSLAGRASTSPIIERVHRIQDMIIASTKTRDLIGYSYIQRELGCSEYEAAGAIQRALQLYPDLKEVKLFNAYKYYYHLSMAEPEFKAAVAMKENYIRIEKGRDNRIGHNWEACI
ncbi:hypothetical protein KEJ51_07650 [Candidatus Bathyarchaeota archaeon]|nr:hypothetical protein [Candidatus Bathyarchaeota archaeon]